MHKAASLADEEKIAYCQFSGAHNIKHLPINLCKLGLIGHLNTDAQARDPIWNFLFPRTMS